MRWQSTNGLYLFLCSWIFIFVTFFSIAKVVTRKHFHNELSNQNLVENSAKFVRICKGLLEWNCFGPIKMILFLGSFQTVWLQYSLLMLRYLFFQDSTSRVFQKVLIRKFLMKMFSRNYFCNWEKSNKDKNLGT